MNTTQRYYFLLGLACFFGIMASCTQVEKSITIESLLEEMVDRDAVARFPQPDYRRSSYQPV